jgi:hypothetical protein
VIDKTSDGVVMVSLDHFRKSKVRPVHKERIPSASDWAAIDTMCRRLHLPEKSQFRVRILLGALLIEAANSAHARVCWRAIRERIEAPFREVVGDEPRYQPILDRWHELNAMSNAFWRDWAIGTKPFIDDRSAGFSICN